MDELIKILGVIVAIDLLIISAIPVALILTRRPRAALVVAIAVTVAVFIDYAWNFPEFNAASLGLFGLVGLPAQVMPLSIFLMFGTVALSAWACARRSAVG